MLPAGYPTRSAAIEQRWGGPDPNRLPLAWLIASERRDQSVSQEQLARRLRHLARAEHTHCGAHRQTINRYERGRIIPNPDTLRWLATALSLPTGQMVAAAERQRAIVRSASGSQSGSLNFDALPSTDAQLEVPWTLAGTLTILQSWRRHGAVDQSAFASIPSGSIAAVIRRYQSLEPITRPELGAEGADGGLVEYVNHGIRLIRAMDDTEGGGSHLSYVEAYFQAVAILLNEGRHAQDRAPRLIGSLAQLAQQAGWMAYDANQHGRAQRYYIAGLRLAHEAGDQPVAAHILADIAYQAVSRGDVQEGLAIGEAALRAGQSSPAGVYASLLARVSYAYAVAGRLGDFERACFDAHESLVGRSRDNDPDWMYYMTPSHIDGLAGISLAYVGRRDASAGEVRARRTLLAEGERLLRKTGVQERPLDHPFQRRALFEDAWLALACSAQGNLQGACETAHRAVRRLQSVSSPRSVAVLRVLATDLRKRAREGHVKAFLPELEQALGDQAVSR
jgi:transcriptional regulator with XRE-family HTH domain/tetratricopeptide (TPR) repeat protein